jgi:hypothetical protein
LAAFPIAAAFAVSKHVFQEELEIGGNKDEMGERGEENSKKAGERKDVRRIAWL